MAWFFLGAYAGMVPKPIPMTLEEPLSCCRRLRRRARAAVAVWNGSKFSLVLYLIHYLVAFLVVCISFFFFFAEIPGGFCVFEGLAGVRSSGLRLHHTYVPLFSV